MIKVEDQEHKKMKTVGECLEFFLRNKIFEELVAYALTDNPPGFFKFALNLMSDMIMTLASTSIIA